MPQNLLGIDSNGVIHAEGGRIIGVTTVNAATYDVLATDYLLHVTYTTTGAVTSITLDTDLLDEGRAYIVKDAGGNAAANNITIDTEGSETIEGASTYVISTDYGAIGLYTDGSNWFLA